MSEADSPLNLTLLSWGIAAPVIFLAAVGLACIHATELNDPAPAASVAPTQPAEPQTALLERAIEAVGPLTLRQLFYLATGFLLMLATLVPSYQKIGRLAYPAYGVLLALLGLIVLGAYVDLPFVPVRNNARRWLAWGTLSIQPAEFMKVALALVLARYLRFRDSYRHLAGLLPPFLLTLVPMILIIKEPDLGMTLMLLPVLFLTLFVAGARLRHLALIILLGAATLPIFFRYGMKPYQRDRVMTVFKQSTTDEHWQRGPGYQLRQSKIALGSGGLTGEGWGRGVFLESKVTLLPEEHNDFIFSIIGHQWGLVGCVLVLLAYSVIVFFGIEVATETNDPFGRLLAIGVVVMIVAQALLNIGMTVGLAPITGMTLPFVSAGGSSLWANFLGLGLLLNVAQRRPMLIANPPFEHLEDE